MADSSSVAPERSLYIDGQIGPVQTGHICVEDHGLLYGYGFFETFRTSGGRPHHWSFNRARLKRACVTAGVVPSAGMLMEDEARLQAVVARLLRDHGLTDAVFRYTVTAGRPSPQGGYREPSEMLTFRALPPSAPVEGVALRQLRLRRDNGEWLPRPKSLNYANALLGAEELRRRGVPMRDEGVFLSRHGDFVVETVRQNLVWIRAGVLEMPEADLGLVPGTCLEWLLTQGVSFQPVRATLEQLCAAEAVVGLNAVRGVTPLGELWDPSDRVRLAAFGSAAHPQVREWTERWQAALRVTAEAGANGASV